MDHESIRSLLDHISRQATEVKQDIRYEIQGLKDSINREHENQNSKIETLKEETDKNLVLMDERITDLAKFKWQAIGIIGFLVFISELAVQIFRG